MTDLPEFTMTGFGLRDIRIELVSAPYNGEWNLEIRLSATAANDAQAVDGREVPLRMQRVLPMWLYYNSKPETFDVSDSLKQSVRSLVASMVMHEVDEWLRCNGERVTDPHPEERNR